jgi:tRNA-binding protein
MEAYSQPITWQDFQRIDMRIGTIREILYHNRARKPAYVLTIDFGEDIGIKTSSAQITEHYTPEFLQGKQVVAVINFPPKHVAGVISEVLVLAAVCPEQGTVLLQPTLPTRNGCHVA